VLEPGGRLFLICCSDAVPGTDGPRRVSRQELYDAFNNGWDVESVEPSRFEADPERANIVLQSGGLNAWFAIVRRQG
jgi:hypothetical protein